MSDRGDTLILREIATSLDHGLLVFDDSGRLISSSPRAFELLELPADAANLGTSYPEVERAIEDVSGAPCTLPPLLSDDGERGRAPAAWKAHRRTDGRVTLYTRIPLPNVGFAVMVADGTREIERLTEVRLQAALAERIARAETFEAALEAVLRTICRHAGWRYGESWLSDKKEKTLRRGPKWVASDPDVATFDHAAD